MIWVSTAFVPTPAQQGLTLPGTISVLCVDMVATVQGILKSSNLKNAALITNSSNGGCNVVTQSPAPPSVAARYNYKLFFSTTPEQFTSLASAFSTSSFVIKAHVMCGSTVYFQTITGGSVGTGLKNVSPTNYPSLMNPGSGVCYDSINEPIRM
jgi:hypothetical protein